MKKILLLPLLINSRYRRIIKNYNKRTKTPNIYRNQRTEDIFISSIHIMPLYITMILLKRFYAQWRVIILSKAANSTVNNILDWFDEIIL